MNMESFDPEDDFDETFCESDEDSVEDQTYEMTSNKQNPTNTPDECHSGQYIF